MDIMGLESIEQLANGHEGSSNDPGKIFVGGLSWQTTNDSLRQYFGQFGDVIDCMVMKDQATKRSRGFGFVIFADPASVDKVLASGPHDIDAKRVDPKKSFPRPKLADGQSKDSIGFMDNNAMAKLVTRTKKMFVGGLSSSTTVEDVKSYFEQFGKVEDAMLMYDKQTQRHRGFAFVTFEKEDTVDKVVDLHYHDINNKTVECKKAQPKALMDPAAAVKGVIPVSLTPVLATTCARAGFPITGLPQYYYAGLPYGYLTTNTTALSSSDRLLAAAAAAAAASAGNTAYFATTPSAGDFQTQSAALPLSRTIGASTSSLSTAVGGCAPPMSPPVQQQQQQQARSGIFDQYVVQRMLQGQTAAGQGSSGSGAGAAPAAASRALLTLQEYATAGDFALMNGYAGATGLPYSPLSPVHNGHSFTQANGPSTLFQLGMPTAAFPAAALAGIHGSYQ